MRILRQLALTAIRAIESGETLCLCTISASRGATPRGRGTRMLVGRKGPVSGTVGGGAVEYEAILEAKRRLLSRQESSKAYALRPGAAGDIGMICGGDLRIAFQILANDEMAALRRIAVAENERSDLLLIQDFSRRSGRAFFLSDEADALSFPGKEELLRRLNKEDGLFRLEEDGCEGAEFFVERIGIPGFVHLFGGGHVAQALVPCLAAVDFACIVYEDRDSFLDPALFPGSYDVCRIDFNRIERTVRLKAEDYALVMTRGHAYDFSLQAQILQTPVRYLGVIGSRRKRAIIRQRLLELGFEEGDVARVISPVGLDIGAESPAEIAVSIAAQMIQFRSLPLEGACP